MFLAHCQCRSAVNSIGRPQHRLYFQCHSRSSAAMVRLHSALVGARAQYKMHAFCMFSCGKWGLQLGNQDVKGKKAIPPLGDCDQVSEQCFLAAVHVTCCHANNFGWPPHGSPHFRQGPARLLQASFKTMDQYRVDMEQDSEETTQPQQRFCMTLEWFPIRGYLLEPMGQPSSQTIALPPGSTSSGYSARPVEPLAHSQPV